MTPAPPSRPVDVFLVAVAETAGSTLYGMLDVLLSAGNVHQALSREADGRHLFRVRITSPQACSFKCGNGIPVRPDCGLEPVTKNALVIVPELWLGPDESLQGRYPQLMDWLRAAYASGANLYSSCSGALVLAESGLLDGCPATSHWAYQDQFRRCYPQVRFAVAPTLVFADSGQRLATAGGTTSWHDLMLHIIARHAGTAEALRIAKVFLLKTHDEGQLPYTNLLRSSPHADAVVRRCQAYLKEHFRDAHALSGALQHCGIPERSLKRRFRQASGMSLIEYVQSMRIEEAKRLLELEATTIDDIAAAVGYADFAFFRRLFKRLTGLKPGEYRRMFQRVSDSKGQSH